MTRPTYADLSAAYVNPEEGSPLNDQHGSGHRLFVLHNFKYNGYQFAISVPIPAHKTADPSACGRFVLQAEANLRELLKSSDEFITTAIEE